MLLLLFYSSSIFYPPPPPPSPAAASSSTVLLIVPLVPSIIIGPNVCPASVDTLSTDSLVPFIGFVSHHETNTLLSPTASISAVCDSASVELLRLILSPNVCPPSFEALNITSQFPDLFVHHTM